MPDPRAHLPRASPAHWREVASVFLRLGFTAFGGPAVHVAMMESEIVRRRRWVSHERFLDLLGASNLIPGPSSTELALYLGFERAGWTGLALGGACFILPAASMVTAIAWAYARFGALPALAGVLYGIKPVVISVVAQALFGLAPKALKKSWGLAALGVAAGVAFALGAPAVAVLLGAALASLTAHGAKRPDAARALAPPWIAVAAGAPALAASPVRLAALFTAFVKIGALVFGSGYVLLAFLRADLVEARHWLTEGQLVDAIAVGQVTPGPVFTTATFIGYLVGARGGTGHGLVGALVATCGIFLPGFALVAATRPLVARLRRSRPAGAFLDGVNVAALALMAVVTVQLARTALTDVATVVMALVGAVALIRFKINATWVVLAGGAIGAVATMLR